MYPVTNDFKSKIKENTRDFKTIVQIQHSQGVLNLTDIDIISGSMIYTEASQAGEDFTIGGTVASTFDFTLIRKPEYNDIEFEGATVIPQIGLLLRENIDTENYFLSAPHPSEFQEGEGEEIWEYVPLGIFHIDEVNKTRNCIEIKSIDNMIELDKPYSLSSLSYPATLYQIYTNICNIADVQVGTTTFANMDYIVQNRPEGDFTLRDILGYVAELAGCFARCNRTGALELTWYTPTDIELGPANRFNFLPREDLVQITGVQYSTEDTIYRAGTDEYVIDLSYNPLLQNTYNTVLINIFNHVKDIVFTPYESSWQGNPALQAGDIITQEDRDGNIYTTIVTHSTFKYRGASTLSAKGLPIKAKGYKGSTNKKIANILRKEIKPIGNKLTSLEQAQLNAMQLMANMLGGYAHYEADGFYVTDNPVIANSTKIWKWGINGFGYSDDGGQTWKSAITADGSIVAMLVAANIITADMVQTGILQSEDGSLSLNLNNGAFSFNHNIVQFTDSGLKVMHGLSNEYSEVNYDGFKRKNQYGESFYLNDIYIANGTTPRGQSNWSDESTWKSAVRINLPERFRGKNIKPYVVLRQFPMPAVPLNSTFDFLNTEVRLFTSGYNVNTSPPYVNVKGWSVWDDPQGGAYGDRAYYFQHIEFTLIVIAS
ncbi:MAG TPA: hypothetical protein PKK61_03270 [Defluviitaleaceae bacterium]|nr:hypothetical protein [Defluviitaleaceae bacterium]